MTDKLLNLSKPWSNEADLNIGGASEPSKPISPKKWSNSADLNLWVEWSGDNDLELGRLIKPVSPKKWSNDADLNLAVEWSDKADLDLGRIIGGDAPPVTVIECIGYSVNQSPKSIAVVNLLIDVSANSELPAPITDHQIDFDINVWRGVISDVATVNNQSTKRHITNSNHFSDSPSLPVGKIHFTSEGKKLTSAVTDSFASMPKLTNMVKVEADNGLKLTTAVSHVRNRMDKVNNAVIEQFDHAVDLNNMVESSYLHPPRADCAVASKWLEAELSHKQINSDFNNGIPVRKSWGSLFEEGIYPTGKRPVLPPVVIPEKPRHADLDIKVLWSNKADLEFVRIELDALIVMNEINIYHVASDNTKTAVHPVNASLDFDIDSFVWSFNGQLLGSDNLSLLTHRAKFEINVNGHQLLFTLREFSKANSFANDAYSFTCVTNSQWLGQPYATLHNGTVDNPIGAWQLVADKFTTENFTLNRTQTPEWTLEKDSFSYLNKSAIEIAMQVAEASGAMLQPDKLNDVIHVQPRYKTSPWDWDNLTDAECDHVINADYIDTQSSSDNTTPQLNSVLISGETHGVITEVVKSGTAGDIRAKDILSPLSQDHNVNAELARNIMSDSGEQEVLGLTVPLLPPDSSFGLMLPGEIIRVIYPDKIITGLCISNSVPMQSITDVTQSVSLELNNGHN